MTKKRLKKVYKPMAYLFIGCFLIYILLSQAMSVFSRTAEIDKLEKEVAIVKKEKKDLQNEVSLLNDDDYVKIKQAVKILFSNSNNYDSEKVNSTIISVLERASR